MEATMPPLAEPGYPVSLEIPRPASQSRLTNFPLGIGLFIRYILVIPHIIVLYFLGLASYIAGFIATFAILFTGKYPDGMFNFVVGVQRWGVNMSAYIFSLRDEYPPFSMDAGEYPAAYSVAYPAKLNRILNFPIFGLYIKFFLAIPHFICLIGVMIVGYLIMIVAPFAILFTGSYPEGMHKFMVGTLRWNQRVTAYIFHLTDKYPPFGLS